MGLYTLFFTEMWERLSYYGMRALLVLFMIDQIAEGGLGFTEETATAIYGLYTAAVYLACLPGGWIADRLLGAAGRLVRRHFDRARALCAGRADAADVFPGPGAGGAGHWSAQAERQHASRLSVSGRWRAARCGVQHFLYGDQSRGVHRAAGVQLPRRKINWHYGFTAAGVGMVLGLVQFHFMRRFLGEAGRMPPHSSSAPTRDWSIIFVALLLIGSAFVAALQGWLPINPVSLARWTTWIIVGVAAAYFMWVFLFAGLNSVELGRMVVIGMLFVACAMFWAGFEQAGSSLNLFAKEYTSRTLTMPKFEVPAGWFQSLNPIFIISFAPVFAAMWVALARRNISPSLTAKMAGGLLLLAVGFVVIFFGARQALAVGKVWPTWLIATYLIHTWGELCLSPVGLSAVTKLAPPKLVGQMMGVWFLATSLGNLIAGLLAGNIAYLSQFLKSAGLWDLVAGAGAEDASGESLAAMPIRFFFIVLSAGLTGIVLLIFAKPLKKLAGGIQ